MKLPAFISTALILLVCAGANSQPQTPVVSVALGPDQIGLVRTAQGITTRMSFPDEVQEVICGDLYDAATGRGSFVAQPSGNDVFLKPITTKGLSNLFVKTKSRRIYNFDISIVPAVQAHRVVNVTDLDPPAESPRQPGRAEDDSSNSHEDGGGTARNEPALDAAAEQAEELIRNAKQQANRIIAEAEARAFEMDRSAAQRADREVERRFIQAVMLGLREIRVSNPRIVAKRVSVSLDPRIVTFDDRAFLRYVIQNTSDKQFEFRSVTVEVGSGPGAEAVPVEVVQSKKENRLEPGETVTGVVVFDAKIVDNKSRLTFYLKGEEDSLLAVVKIQ